MGTFDTQLAIRDGGDFAGRATWTDLGTATLAIGSRPVLVGLALTSHDNSATASATFDNVAIAP